MFQSLLLLVLSFNRKNYYYKCLGNIYGFNPYCYWSYLLTDKKYSVSKHEQDTVVSILIVTGPIF